jgi:hypothetical protein
VEKRHKYYDRVIVEKSNKTIVTLLIIIIIMLSYIIYNMPEEPSNEEKLKQEIRELIRIE